MLRSKKQLLLLLGSFAVGGLAASSVNVAVQAAFNSPPFLVELLETAAEENATSYFPLLDRIADGHFDRASTDKDLYDLFLRTLQDDGHVTTEESLSSFEFAMAIHSTAPRIEAHYQFYGASVLPSIQANQDSGCESWVHFNGRQYCTPDLAVDSGAELKESALFDLPFDRILGDLTSKTPSVLYADPMSEQFRQFHRTVSLTARSGKSSYRLRYKPSSSLSQTPLSVSGYGVGLDLKRTDYIVIDDRQAEEDAASIDAEATLADDEVADLKPLSASELKELDMKAASFVMDSADPLDTLNRLVQDFPKHSRAMAANNISAEFKKEHASNREMVLPSGLNIVWVNGREILARDFDAYHILETLRRERSLISTARELGLSGAEAIKLLAHPAIAKAASGLEPQRYDWQDKTEGGNVIIWMNNIEVEKRYEGWSTEVRAFLQRTYPGQLPQVRRDAHNLVYPVDFADYKDVELVLGNLQNFVKRKVPMRFGLVPRFESDASIEQAKTVYHLLDVYGLNATMDYLTKMQSKYGRKMKGPVHGVFEAATKDRKVRRDKVAKSLLEVLEDENATVQLESVQHYLRRLGLDGATPPLIVNGVPIANNQEWLQEMGGRVGSDNEIVQRAVYEGILTNDDYIPDVFLTGASPRRNPIVVPENDADVRHVALSRLSILAEGHIGSIRSIPVSEDTVESEHVHMVVIADLDTEDGSKMVKEALAFREQHDNVELFFVHNPGVEGSLGAYTFTLYQALSATDRLSVQDVAKVSPASGAHPSMMDAVEAQLFWTSATPLLEATGFQPGSSGLLLNGRVLGPLPATVEFSSEDFDTLLAYEHKKRLAPTAAVIQSLGLEEKVLSPLGFARLSNFIALASSANAAEGIFDGVPPARIDAFNKWESEHTAIVVGDVDTASIQIVASIDPASEIAQRWIPIFKVLSELSGIHMRLFLNPKERLEELPVKRFYRHVLESRPIFESNGSLKALSAHFEGLPVDALLTMAMDVPPSWLVAPEDSVHDLDNIKLSSVKDDDISAIYGLQYILIEGHSRDVTLGSPPKGAQLLLGSKKNTYSADTIVMSNLGYFQFKANPGFYNLTLQQGRSSEIFNIDSAGAKGYHAQAGDETTEIALTTFRGTTIYPRLSRKPGMEEEDVLESSKTVVDELAATTDAILSKVGFGNIKSADILSKAQNMFAGGGKSDGNTDVQRQAHADINIFSVASGHLYERMLNIMMVSVMKHTQHTVKFWFIEQFLSPSFKALLPSLAEEYNFRYEMVTYKWPHWLRGQKEKQREIWGYKILFLDVLFPLDLDKVIFVDADQIVRTDMYELVTHDLEGAPYGFTPMCDSRTEMEGFRFWKQGYWKTFLKGAPYHISALYVVDLARFRALGAGDRLRQTYHQLSADPASLSNLDQDLPNHMQHVLPIHSLPQEWLWCETWCSDESLGVAKTIDLCNNPLTKEPKLERARRQVPEWNLYDGEIKGVMERWREGMGESGLRDGGLQAEMQLRDAEAVRDAEKGVGHDEL